MSELNEQGSGECTINDDNPAQSDHEDGSARASELSQESHDQEEQIQEADLTEMTPLQIARARLDLALRDLVERSMLENALEALRRMHDVPPQPNVSKTEEAPAQEGAPGPRKRTRRPPTKRAPRKHLRLEPDPDSGITKIHEFHIDLTRFNENSSLYEMCRSWIKDKPLNVPEQDQDCKVADKEVDVDSIPVEDQCGIYTLPAPIPAPKDKNLRIASPVPRSSEEFFVASDDSETVPVGDLLDAHKKHWKNVRQKCVKAAMVNEERYKESLAILEDASKKCIKSAQPPQQAQDRI